MIILLSACAALCVLMLGWMFRPLRTPRAFYALSFLCAIATLGIYMVLGRPDLPAHPTGAAAIAERRQMMEQEFSLIARLEKDADDADALIRLAALQVLQGRISDETVKMLDRADKLLPNDKRTAFIRSAMRDMKAQEKK